MDYDIIVLGAGMFGSSAAKYLRKRHPELNIAIVGPNDNTHALARGQHYDEARICRRVENLPIWAPLINDGTLSYAETEKESGIPFYTPCGVVWVATASNRQDVLSCMQTMEACVPAGQRAPFVYRDGDSGQLRPSNGDAANNTIDFFTSPQEAETLFHNTISVHQFATQDGTPTYYIADYGTGCGGTVHPTNYVLAQLKIAESIEPRSHYTHICEVATDVVPHSDGDATRYTVKTDKGTTLHAPRVLVATSVFSVYHNVIPNHVKALVKPTPEHVVLLRVTPPHATMEENVAAIQKLPAVIRMTGEEAEQFYTLPPRYYEDKQGWFIKMGGSHVGVKKGDVSTLQGALEWYEGHQEVSAGSVERLCAMLSTIYPAWKMIEGETDPATSLPNLYVVRCVWDMTEGEEIIIDLVDGKGWLACIGANGRGAKACDTVGNIAAYRVMGEALPEDMAHYDSQFRVRASP